MKTHMSYVLLGVSLIWQTMAAAAHAETRHVWEKVEITPPEPAAVRESLHGCPSLGGPERAGFRQTLLRILGRWFYIPSSHSSYGPRPMDLGERCECDGPRSAGCPG